MERLNIKTLIKSFAEYYKQDLENLFSKIDEFYFTGKLNSSSKIQVCIKLIFAGLEVGP